jgi:hypothetical protein
MQRSTTLILAGGLLVGVGLGLVQAGIRAGAPCIDCEPDGPEAVIDAVAGASADMAVKPEASADYAGGDDGTALAE